MTLSSRRIMVSQSALTGGWWKLACLVTAGGKLVCSTDDAAVTADLSTASVSSSGHRVSVQRSRRSEYGGGGLSSLLYGGVFSPTVPLYFGVLLARVSVHMRPLAMLMYLRIMAER